MTTTALDAAAAGSPATAAPSHPARRIAPFDLLVPVAAVAALVLSLRPFRDPDLYWHVRLGAWIVDHRTVHGAGAGWSLVPPVHGWTTPEWLSEVVLHWFVAVLSWRGALVFQLACSLAFFVLFAHRMRLWSRGGRAGQLLLASTLVTLAPYLQPRPQTISLVFLAWLARPVVELLTDGAVPRLRSFAPLVCLWAQCHGLWLLAPAAVALAAGARCADDAIVREAVLLRRAALVVLVSTAAGCVNPLGLSSLTLPLRLHAAASSINEWQPTTFTSYMTWGLLVLVAGFAVHVARTPARAPRSELVWVGALTCFALLAFRNVAPAVILIAPLVVRRVTENAQPVEVTDRERRLLLAAVAALAAVAVAVGALGALATRPIPRTMPVALARDLADGRSHRVVDDYDLGGLVLAFGGPRVRVAVDGRADYYGASYIAEYERMLALDAGWQRLFHRLAPDRVLVATNGPMPQWLLAHGWRTVGREAGYSLLAAP